MFMRAVRDLEQAKATRLVLDPLDAEAIGLVVTDVLRAQAEVGLLGIADSAHGVPFFLIELLRGLLEEGLVRIDDSRAVLVEDRLPSRVRDGMRARLDRVSGPARQAAIAASVLGRSFRFDDLAAMLATTPAALLGRWKS
jgi:predicted ATPase